jgi:asparagine synthase (glutamine-hydrolysing)
MISKLRAFASLYRELGPRWTLFRLAYAFRLRTGIIRLQMPMGEWSDYKKYVRAPRPERRDERFFRPVDEGQLPEKISWNPQTAIDVANRLLNGEIKYFSHQFVKTDFPPNWHKDHVTGIELDSTKHWSKISDDHVVARRAKPDEAISNDEGAASLRSQRHNDIKYVWEPNRFAFVYTLVRPYAATQDEKYPAAFWTLIEDWAQHNPPNTGPNWMDGQEISLRLMAWTFGYNHFVNSPSTTPERKENFILCVAAQAERIYKNIGYAISTRSNHTISEAFGLWMIGLLFPELKNSDKYLSLGKQLLEQEAANQIFPDGSYSMYSLNYHRFILHIYLYAIKLGELNTAPFSTQLKQSVTKSIEYLSRLINPETGEMPVYGSNDGALVLPLNNCDFTDYRPLLQLGWYITKGEFLFEPGPWDEDIFWLCGISRAERSRSDSGGVDEAQSGETSIPYGGNYLLRQANSHALIRCTDFTSRPSHADQLHVDLRIHGHNLAVDAGTYLYSGEGHWRNGLAHTSVHNTVAVGNKDQMTKLSRFTWTNWSKGKVLKHEKDVWQGEHDGFKPVSHNRIVKPLGEDRWLVIDKLTANESHHYALQWLLNDYLFEHNGDTILFSLDEMKYKLQVGMLNGNGELSVVRADPESTRGWRSRYYGHKEPAISIMLEADLSNVTFWSYFGFEDDVVEIAGYALVINSEMVAL